MKKFFFSPYRERPIEDITGCIKTALMALFSSITGKAAGGRGQQICWKTSRVIFRQMAIKCTIILMTAKKSGRYTAWLMHGVSSRKPLITIKNRRIRTGPNTTALCHRKKMQGEELSMEEIKSRRQDQSLPILISLGLWMKEQYIHALPKSVIGEAFGYSIKRRETLSRYIENGMLNIDNNPVENSIRPVALGGKNYLFAGSHEAAKRSGMLYSLFGTAN